MLQAHGGANKYKNLGKRRFMTLTYKQKGIGIAIITIVFTVIRMIVDAPRTGLSLDLFLFTIPGLLFAYGIYTWDDRRKKADESGGQGKPGAEGWFRRKEHFTGTRKMIVALVVCLCIAILALQAGASLLVGEDSVTQGVDVAKLLLFMALGVFIWKGYAVARVVLATFLTGVGMFLLFVIMNSSVFGEQDILVPVMCVLWTACGMVLFFVNRIGSAVEK